MDIFEATSMSSFQTASSPRRAIPGANWSFHASRRTSALQRRRCASERDNRESHSPQKLLEYIGDRDALFALLSRFMPFEQASAAAAALMERYSSLERALAASEAELRSMTKASACIAGVLRIVRAASIQLQSAPMKQGPRLKRWSDLEAYIAGTKPLRSGEELRVLFLDTRNRLIADEAFSRLDSATTWPDHRVLTRRAVELHATAVILVSDGTGVGRSTGHRVQRELQASLSAIGVVLHDHIIYTPLSITSLCARDPHFGCEK